MDEKGIISLIYVNDGQIKVVAFDIDGTLSDVNEILAIADNHIYNIVKTSYPRMEFESPHQSFWVK